MFNPGSAPIPDADPDLAAANITVFAAAVVADLLAADDLTVEEPVRDTSANTDGRYGYVLTAGDKTVRVSMPGVPLERVRDDMSADAPCLQVNGEAWWWPSAVVQVVGALRPSS